MIGRTLVEFDELTKAKMTSEHQIDSEAILKARGLGRANAISPFDLDLYSGEVVGLAGLLGSGRTELASLLFGSDKPDTGSIMMNDKPVEDHSPLGSIKPGLHYARKIVKLRESWMISQFEKISFWRCKPAKAGLNF